LITKRERASLDNKEREGEREGEKNPNRYT
jgi:hypothetical protein